MKLVLILFICVASFGVVKGQSDECQKFWTNWRSLQDSLNFYYDIHIFSQLENKQLNEENKKFLISLREYLNIDWKEKRDLKVLEQPIYPIFKVKTGQTGIFTFPMTSCEGGICSDISLEAQTIEQYDEYFDGYITNSDTMVWCPTSFANLVSQKATYVYTLDGHYEDSIISFGHNADPCIEYYLYQLSNQEVDQVLFGSPYQLDLEHIKDNQLDNALENQSAWKCSDCEFSYEPEIAFAKLSGIDNLYFTYVDKFSVNDQYNFPSRDIIMVLPDGRIASLWGQSVDLFGCSCL